MSLSLIINSNNVVKNGYNSQYVYNFIQGVVNIPDGTEMCVSQITIPYSWFNVNAQMYNNAQFQYTFPTSTGQQTFTVNLANGFYSAQDIQQVLETNFIENGNYLVDSQGNNVYYMSIADDSTYYAVQLVCYAVPTSLPSGYTNPANMTFPTEPTTPQLSILNNNFGSLIGYTAGKYPSSPVSANFSTESNTLVNASPVNSLVLRCDIISNNVVMPSDILDSVPITSTFGSNINYQPTFARWIKCKAGKSTALKIEFYDQNLNQVQMNDYNILVCLLLKFPDSTSESRKA
jgi:hypothetical protein